MFGLITFLNHNKPVEIIFPATSGYFDTMNAGDYFNAKDKGYIESEIKENCKYDFKDTCPMVILSRIR